MTRSRLSAPASSSRHVRHASDSHGVRPIRLGRLFEGDADDEDDDVARPLRLGTSPHRSPRSNKKSLHRRTKSTTFSMLNEGDLAFSTPVTKRRKALRPSLAGPRVQELTVHDRARIVSLMAQDCIIKLLSIGLSGAPAQQGHEAEWRSSWDNLQGERRMPLAHAGELKAEKCSSTTSDSLRRA